MYQWNEPLNLNANSPNLSLREYMISIVRTDTPIEPIKISVAMPYILHCPTLHTSRKGKIDLCWVFNCCITVGSSCATRSNYATRTSNFFSYRLKHSIVVANIRPRDYTRPTDQWGTNIADNVAIEVGHHHHVKLLWSGNELYTTTTTTTKTTIIWSVMKC